MKNSPISVFGATHLLINPYLRVILLVLVLYVGFCTSMEAQSGKTNFQLGQQAFFEARYDSALFFLSLAKTEYESNGDVGLLFEVKVRILKCHLRKGEYDLEDQLNELLDLVIENNLQGKITDFLLIKGDWRRLSGKYDEALDLYDSAMAINQNSGDYLKLIEGHLGISSTHQKLGNTDLTMDHSLKAQGFYDKQDLKDSYLLGRILDRTGQAYWIKGNYDLAIGYFRKAIDKKLEVLHPDHPEIGSLYHNIGVMYRSMLQYNRALEYLSLSLEIQKKTLGKDHLEVSHSYNTIGYALYNKKNYNDALKIHQKAYEIRYKALGPNHFYTLQSLGRIGLCYGGLGLMDKAEEYFKTTLEGWKESLGENHYYVSYAFYNIGAVYDHIKEYQKAADYFQQAADIGKEIYGKHHYDQADNYNRLANCFLKIGEITHATRYFHLALEQNLPGYQWNQDIRSLPETQYFISFREVLRSLVGLSWAFSSSSEIEEINHSLIYLDRAEEVLTSYKKNFTKDADLVSISEYAKELIDAALEAHYKLFQFQEDTSRLEEIFRYSEFLKNSALLSKLEDDKAKKVSGIPDDLLFQERRYREKKDSLHTAILADLKSTGQDESNLRNLLFQINSEHEELIGDLEKNYPEYTARKYGAKPISVKQLQKVLAGKQNKTNLVQYHLTIGGKLFSSIIGENSHHLVVTEQDDLPDQIFKLRNAIVNQKMDSFQLMSYSIYQAVFEPLTKFVDADADLVIVPEGVLAYLPFDLLLTKQTSSGSYRDLPYLIKKHNISYDLSSTLFAHQSLKQVADNSELVAFAPEFKESKNDSILVGGLILRNEKLEPLAGAYEESMIVSEEMGGELRAGTLATESKFKEEAENYGILHLATHSIVNNSDPDYSKLLFSESENDDGQLHAFELQNMNLNAQLVTLSACSTGFGKVQEGEGVMSLARAFSAAGVPSVLMSLWPVSDEHTARLMELFYENLNKGLPKNEALHMAKLTYLEDGDPLGANPFYWSSFVLIGDLKPIIKKENDSEIIILSVGALVVLLIAVFFKRSGRSPAV